MIALANPGYRLGVYPNGVRILIPRDPLARLFEAADPSETDPNRVSFRIDGRLFKDFTFLSYGRTVSSIGTFSISMAYEPDELNLSRFGYQELDILVGGEPVFRGTLTKVTPSLDESKTLSLSGYSLPGKLASLTLPASLYPLQFKGMNIFEICERVAGAFGISVEKGENVDLEKFEDVTADHTVIAMSFLSNLAKQRGCVLSDTPEGALLVHAPSDGPALTVVELEEGQHPLVDVSTESNEERFYSSVTGVSKSVAGQFGDSFTVDNPFCEDIRPYTFNVPDARNGGLEKAANHYAATMFATAVSYSATVEAIRSEDGLVFLPGDLVGLKAPGAMVPERYQFMARGVDVRATPTAVATQFDLVVPTAYTGRLPTSVPWAQ